MKKQENKTVTIIGIIVGTAIIGAIVCGILECFGISTGVIGGVFGAIPMLFLVVFMILQITNEVIK